LKNKILVTGGLGFIGSHVVVELLDNDYEVIIIDNLANSNISILDRINVITKKKPIFYQLDIRDYDNLKSLFINHHVDAVIHLAALKSVEESVKNPIMYYENNVIGTKVLMNLMDSFEVRNFIFSSSATVYGEPQFLPITEIHQLAPFNPYGESKMECEIMCNDFTSSHGWNCVTLRYFNPIGSHSSHLLGESSSNPPTNIIPLLCKVAYGLKTKLLIYGDTYETIDGTCIRDYIHVTDLAKAHLCSLSYILNDQKSAVFNIGTGVGYSVFQLLESFQKINKLKIPYEISEKRSGDASSVYANCDLAYQALGWKAFYGIERMVKDSWESYLYLMSNPTK